MPIAAVNGLQIYYEQHGDSANPALVCVQGLGGDCGGWAGQLPLWSRHYRTIVFDNRDAGRSSYVEHDYDVAALAADLIGLLDSLGLERFHLVGISLGGAIAQEVALAVGARLLSLTLIVTYAGADRWFIERTKLEERLLVHKNAEHMLEELLIMTLSPGFYEDEARVEALREEILANPYPQARPGFVRQLRASATHDSRGRLGSLTIPTHVIAAEQDIMVPVWRSRELAALIPGSVLSVVSGSGHSVAAERPDELAELVHSFVRAETAAAA
jgi:pimeloyl-ACP methyl ester carboxylesterase